MPVAAKCFAHEPFEPIALDGRAVFAGGGDSKSGSACCGDVDAQIAPGKTVTSALQGLEVTSR